MDTAKDELVEVLQEARAFLARPGNDFVWSGWEGPDEALRELDEKIAAVLSGPLPERLGVSVLFAPTGPIQEVSISSGWGQAFLAIAAHFDAASAQVYGKPHS